MNKTETKILNRIMKKMGYLTDEDFVGKIPFEKSESKYYYDGEGDPVMIVSKGQSIEIAIVNWINMVQTSSRNEGKRQIQDAIKTILDINED